MGAKPFYCDIDGQKVGILKDWRQNPLTTALRNTLGLSLTADHSGLTVFDVDLNSLFSWTGSAWVTPSGGIVPSASETVQGIIEIATQVETDAGLDDERAVTPLKLATVLNALVIPVPSATETVEGILELATQAETDAGVDDTTAVTPLKLATYIASLPTGGQTENFNWRFDDSLAATDPGAGRFRFDGTPALTTQIYVNDLCDITGLDVSNLFNALSGNFHIYIQQTDDATKFVQFATIAPWTDNGGWFTIPVSFIQVGAGGFLSDNSKCTWYVINKNTGGAGSGSSVQGNLFAGGGITSPSTLGLALDTSGLYYLLPAGAADNVYTFSDGLQRWGMVNQSGPYQASLGGITPGVDRTAQLNTILADGRVRDVVIDEGDIIINGTLNCQGKTLSFKNNARIVGTGNLDNCIIDAGSRQVIFGLGITITNSQANGDYFHAKWYGTVGNNTVDEQPALQKSSDTVIANVLMPRTVKLVGGETYRIDSPWIMYKWTGTDYTFFTCNIDGTVSAFFANGAATGHAVINVNYGQTFGIGYQVARSSTISGIIVRGQFSPSWNPFNIADYTRDYATWSSVYGFRDTFHSPYSGIVLDPFRNTPALPPDGGYPGLSFWYRGTNIGSGSSAIRIKDCEVSGFTVDIMCSPNGVTQNCEDIHVEDCRLEVAKVAYATGQDQIKNNTISRCVTWDRVHTLMDTRSYGFGTGLLPNVDGWNIASGSIIRIWNIDTPRFPASIRNVFSELLYMIGDGDGGVGLNVSDCEFGFNTYGSGYTVPPYHVKGGNIKFQNCGMRYYDDAFNVPIVFYGQGFQFEYCYLNMAPVLNNPYQNNLYYGATFKNCRSGSGVIGWENIELTDPSVITNPPAAYGDVQYRINSYNKAGGASVPGGVKHMNYVFHCGSYLGYKLLGCCYDWTVDSFNRKITVTGLGARHKLICVGDFISDEDTNFHYGIVESIDRVAGTMVIRNVPVNITTGETAWTFGIQWVRRISGHFIGDLTSGTNSITNCAFDPAFPYPHPGTRLSIGQSDGEDLAVVSVDTASGIVYLSGTVDHTELRHYFPPVNPAYSSMDAHVGMFYDPPVYTDIIVANAYPYMFPLNAKVYTETAGGSADYYPSASEWRVIKGGFLQPSAISRVDQAQFQPFNEIIPIGVPDQLDYVEFTDSITGRRFKATIETILDLLLPRLSTPVLTATVISFDEIELTWTNVANEVSYKLEVSPNGTTGWVQIGGTIPADTLIYNHTGLLPVTTYYYRLRAIGDGISYSNSTVSIANATTIADTSSFPHLSTFTAADGTLLEDYVPESGNPFTGGPGTMEIQSNEALPKAPVTGPIYYYTSTGSTQDYTITANITIDDGGSYGVVSARMGSGVGIQFLILSGLLYGIDIADGGTNFAYLAVAGTVLGVEREYKFVFHGNMVDSYVDGVLIDLNRVFNAGNNGTSCGIGQVNSLVVGTSFNRFEVN